MNHKFVLACDRLRGWNKIQLHLALARIVEEGIEGRDQCYLLASTLKQKTNANIDILRDRTGYECFINHIHVDDYVAQDLGRQAMCFTAAILQKWNEGKFEGNFNAIVSLHDNDASVRFHQQRPNEYWLAQNVDGYEEALLELTSSDVAFLDLL